MSSESSFGIVHGCLSCVPAVASDYFDDRHLAGPRFLQWAIAHDAHKSRQTLPEDNKTQDSTRECALAPQEWNLKA